MEKESDTMIRLPVLGHFTYREWHALVNGFYVGFTSYKDRDHEYTKEKHYWRAGFLAGWLAMALIVLTIGPRLLP